MTLKSSTSNITKHFNFEIFWKWKKPGKVPGGRGRCWAKAGTRTWRGARQKRAPPAVRRVGTQRRTADWRWATLRRTDPRAETVPEVEPDLGRGDVGSALPLVPDEQFLFLIKHLNARVKRSDLGHASYWSLSKATRWAFSDAPMSNES